MLLPSFFRYSFSPKGTGKAKTLFRGERSSMTLEKAFKEGFTPKGVHNNLELQII